MKTTFRSYVVASFVSAVVVMLHALNLKRYFFNAVIYLSRSKFATVVLGNAAVAVLLLCGKLVQAVFLGPLRFREEERLHIRVREAVIETCLAMTVFREEFNSKFIAMFAVLLFLKVFHWLGKDRVEYMEEQPNASALAHARLVGLMSVLLALDFHLLVACISTTLAQGPSMMVLFAFEFAVLVISLVSMVLRHLLNCADAYLDGHWDAKGMFSFYNELLADVSQLMVYMAFFLYVQMYYTLPLHIVRDIYLTFTKFQKRVSDFMRYRRVANSMNELFSDATEEDFADGDRTCIVCREDMRVAKKLSCGHMFHARCLQSWLRRQLSCPVCRAVVDVSDAGAASRSRRRGAANNNNSNNPNVGANRQVPRRGSVAFSALDGFIRRIFGRRPRLANNARPAHPFGNYPMPPPPPVMRGMPPPPFLNGHPAMFMPPPPLAPWMLPPGFPVAGDPFRQRVLPNRGVPPAQTHPPQPSTVGVAPSPSSSAAPLSQTVHSTAASASVQDFTAKNIPQQSPSPSSASSSASRSSQPLSSITHAKQHVPSSSHNHPAAIVDAAAPRGETLRRLLHISDQLEALRSEVHSLIRQEAAVAAKKNE